MQNCDSNINVPQTHRSYLLLDIVQSVIFLIIVLIFIFWRHLIYKEFSKINIYAFHIRFKSTCSRCRGNQMRFQETRERIEASESIYKCCNQWKIQKRGGNL